jgi:hypothetical protein
MAGGHAGAIISNRFTKVRQEGDEELKKFMILASVVAIVIAALALPALAQQRNFGGDDERWDNSRWEDNNNWGDNKDNNNWWDNDWWKDHDDKNDDDFDNRNDDFDRDFDRFFDFDRDRFDRDFDRNNNNDAAAPVITQESDQTAESGDVSQSFNVSNTGDNSNQCAGVQGVANTGNAQNQLDLIQYGSEADEFSFEDSGASINVSPTNLTSCDQQVNQAATAAYYGR